MGGLPCLPMRLQPRVALPLMSIVLALGGCSDRRPSKPPSFEGAAYPPGVIAPGFTLKDQHGGGVSLGARRGFVVVLTFVSTRCRACVLAAQQIRGALDELAATPTHGRGTVEGAVSVLFVSTDPHVDTPLATKRFLSETGLAGRADYLTGTEAQLRRVWRAYRVAPRSAGGKTSENATTVLLIGRTGAERDAFGLEQLTPEGLAHDIRLLRDGRPTAD
jgi:protein SCO1/2